MTGGAGADQQRRALHLHRPVPAGDGARLRGGALAPADFIRGRYSSPTLALAVALTGLIATIPYIALQLVGIQVVLQGMGIQGSGLALNLQLLGGIWILQTLPSVILGLYTRWFHRWALLTG
jgi:Na+/proline symporter